jgi:hypothetical protein
LEPFGHQREHLGLPVGADDERVGADRGPSDELRGRRPDPSRRPARERPAGAVPSVAIVSAVTLWFGFWLAGRARTA